MLNQFSRTELLLGHDAMEKLAGCRVAVFGIGGVGGYTVEALARSGVGALDLVDDDRVCLTNINRQILALRTTVGQYKVDAMKSRLLDINPDAQVGAHRLFYLPETADQVDLSCYDYVVDCIETVKAKVELAVRCNALGVPLIASMGTGNKLDPAAFEIADIGKTTVCPLARVMRLELKRRGIRHLKVVYSREVPRTPAAAASPSDSTQAGRRSTPGSTSFCPPVAGMILAGEVVRDLTGVR